MKHTTNHIPLRVVLYPKDVENITGRGSRTCRRLLQKIKQACGKSRNEFVTVKEFCLFTGISEELVKDFLKH
ncbi:MAG: hypothetical protein HYX40_06380 [Sphingobacteriales bacterium]|nr:hypothetical protein [Sphingobacteriales bacterium]